MKDGVIVKKDIKLVKKKFKDIESNQVGLLIQGVLSVFLVAFTILTIFESTFLVLTEILVGFLMFVMAYNNYKTFKRKGITYAYTIMGILMIVLSIMLIIK